MDKFDTKVQYLKYRVLCEVARLAWEDKLTEGLLDIPKTILPGKTPTMRCCVYKERAILAERVKLATGGDVFNPNVIEVIDIACDECPAGGFHVTDNCRGCLAHRCENACPVNAISFDVQLKAHIDKNKCLNCGKCAAACPYGSIVDYKRPCERSCKVKAISPREGDLAASIDNSKCTSCGACVYQCPFGAISDKSFILETIHLVRQSQEGGAPVYALVAPAIGTQFKGLRTGQIIEGIHQLGFSKVAEAAVGADLVVEDEAKELAEKGFLTSSCCPAFVSYVKKQFPELASSISHNLSPMAAAAREIKRKNPLAKVVFIGPCTAKKMEYRQPEVREYIDSVLTFEELQALFDSRDILLEILPDRKLDNASVWGRGFARSGGVSRAIRQSLLEQGLDFDFRPVACNGIDACREALTKASRKDLKENFVEGMACVGGCIGGAGCLTHGNQNKSEMEKYASEAAYDRVLAATEQFRKGEE